jgi:hypothetical protein
MAAVKQLLRVIWPAQRHLKNYYNFKWRAEIWLPLVRSHVCVWCYCNGIKIKCLLYLVRFMMLLLLSVYVIRVKLRTGRGCKNYAKKRSLTRAPRCLTACAMKRAAAL